MSKKFNLIKYFFKVLKVFIKAKIKIVIKKYKSWDKLVKKAIIIKV